MQPRTSPPKRKSMNHQYDKPRNFHRRSVHVNILHNPVVPHHFDRTTHKKPQNQENHLGNSQQQNTSSYTVIRRVNKPTIRYPYVQEEIPQFPGDQSSSNSDPCGRTFDDIPKRYEYCVRRSGHNNDRSMPIKIQKKGKYYPEDKAKNYETQYLRIGKNHPERLQTLELEDSFQQQEREIRYHNTQAQMTPDKQFYLHNTEKKHKKTQQDLPRRKSTNDYLQTPKRQTFEQQYLVIKKSPKLSSKNRHFVEYAPLSRESEDILEEIQRLYMNSEDQNVRIIRQIPQKDKKKSQSPKRQSYLHSNYRQQQSLREQSQFIENQKHLEREIQARFHDIENIIQVENHNLKDHNQYLLNVIKKMQAKDRMQISQIQKQAAEIRQLVQERNAYMERCLQLQHAAERSNKESLDHYLQNSTASDIQNQTININQSKNNQRLQGFRKHFEGTIQPSTKHDDHQNTSYGMRKQQNKHPTPKFSSTRQSPQQIRRREPTHEQLLFEEEGSDILNLNEQKDQWTNANSGFSMVRNLSNNIPLNFYTQEMNEQQKSQSMSNQSSSKMARYYTQPPNTPLPIHFVSQIDTLNEQFNYLMKQYKATRDVSIRKECVKIAQKIKQLKNDNEFDETNKTNKIYGENKGLKKLESLEMEIQQNKAKYGHKEIPNTNIQISRLRSN